MALTTAKAFDEFKDKLLLTETQKETVESRRSSTEGYLRGSFPASSDLPLRSTYLMGSAGRETIIRPLDDVDVLAIFNNKDDIFDRLYRYDSKKFLYRVRDALNSYKVEVVGGARASSPPLLQVGTARRHSPGIRMVGRRIRTSERLRRMADDRSICPP